VIINRKGQKGASPFAPFHWMKRRPAGSEMTPVQTIPMFAKDFD
jgi:hypothetical protein